MLPAALTLYLSAIVVGSTTSSPTSQLFESLYAAPEGWKGTNETPEKNAIINFKIAMTSPYQHLLEQTLYQVSDPSNSRYGQHLQHQELRELLQPSDRASQAVTRWLSESGVQQIHDQGEWINFRATVSQAEILLNTTFSVYRNSQLQVDAIRTLQYSIPAELHHYIDMIQPTTRFMTPQPQIFTASKLDSAETLSGRNDTFCNTTVTPACLRALYNIPVQAHLDKDCIGFAAFSNFLEQYPRYDDLFQFEREYAPYTHNQSFSWIGINGGMLNQTANIDASEGNLDVEYIMAMGHPVPIRAYSTAGRGPGYHSNEPYLEYLTFLLSQSNENLPHTLSTSYGDVEQMVPRSYQHKVCQMFGQLGARGVSVIFASGDKGTGAFCRTNDGTNRKRFLPIFPATCPYVTSVGGTEQIKPESATWFSSGGFSDTFSAPHYQKSATRGYLAKLGNQWQGFFNASGRGFPDVAAQSNNFVIINQGRTELTFGTSAAAPVFAGIIAVINNLRIQAGMPRLGFLNPWIYSVAHRAFNDITHGGSTGCFGVIPYASWNATTGWDPVTGFGTPDFLKLRALALAA